MNIALIVDVDTDREDYQVIIKQVNRIVKDKIILTKLTNIVTLMAVLCEGVCSLIHCADQAGEKPSAQSLRDCIKHITEGFADANYKGVI